MVFKYKENTKEELFENIVFGNSKYTKNGKFFKTFFYFEKQEKYGECV